MSGSSHIDKVIDIIPSIQALSIISYQHQIKKVYIYLNLINLESDNMGLLLVPYTFNSEYSIEEINNRQHLIAEPVVQSTSFTVRLQSLFRTLTTHQSKNIV